MRQEPILYSGVCGNECIRLMAQRECGMDELAAERLLRSWKTVASGDTSTTAVGSVYLQGGGWIIGNREEWENMVRQGVYSMPENSRRENIIPLSAGRPLRGLAEDYSALIPDRTSDGGDFAFMAAS